MMLMAKAAPALRLAPVGPCTSLVGRCLTTVWLTRSSGERKLVYNQQLRLGISRTRIHQIVSGHTRVRQDTPGCIRIHQRVLGHTRMYQDTLARARTYKYVPEYASVQGHTRVYQDMPARTRIHQDRSRIH